MTAATLPPIEGKTTVNVPVEQAFEIFTASFGSWWPHAYHIGQAEVADAILESHEGAAGTNAVSTAANATGVACWPGRRRIASCSPGRSTVRGSSTPDPAHASEIEVRFHTDGPTQTTVEVEHRHFERIVDGQDIYADIHGGGGWPALLESYAQRVNGADRG